jgi:lysophospholipase L1-like esterase
LSLIFANCKLLTLIATVAVVSALLGASSFAALTSKPQSNVEAYGRQRIEVLKRQLAEAPEGYVFIAGDSHAELFSAEYIPCGRQSINGGISGASAEVYSDLIQPLPFTKAPGVIILTIGTNNLSWKRSPSSAAAIGSFRSSAGQLITRLKAVGSHLIVNAIPPVGDELRGYYDTAAIATYSETLRQLCLGAECEFLDPFVAARSPEFGISKVGAMADAVHLAAYKAAYSLIGARICSWALAGSPQD